MHVYNLEKMAKDSRQCEDFVNIDANAFFFDDADLSDKALKFLTEGKIIIVKNYPTWIKPKAIFDLEYLEQQLKLPPNSQISVRGTLIHGFRAHIFKKF